VAPLGVVGPLHTEGNRVLDGRGNPLVLRGVNRVGLHAKGAAPPTSEAEIDHARAWGMNVVRVLLTEAYSDPQCATQYDPTYFDAVDDIVRWTTSRGMVALLDLHQDTRVPCGQNDRWRMADMPGSVDFWRVAARRYGSNPLVAFDLYNEPNNITSEQWRNGGILEDQTLIGTFRWTAAGMQQLYEAVRSTGAENLVVISGNGWAADPSPILDGGGIAGYNIVYGLHPYNCSHVNDPLCTGNPANKAVHVGEPWIRLARSYPVMVTEFGWPDPGDGAFNASVIKFAQSQDPPWGWIAFAWDGTAYNHFIIVGNLATYDPTPSGWPVKQALAGPP
jgi:hypothetical protein